MNAINQNDINPHFLRDITHMRDIKIDETDGLSEVKKKFKIILHLRPDLSSAINHRMSHNYIPIVKLTIYFRFTQSLIVSKQMSANIEKNTFILKTYFLV